MMIRSKDPVPTDYTGAPGAYVTAEEVRAWCGPRAMVHVGKLAYPPGNIAIRLPKDIIGIDVDAHSGKAGGIVLQEAEKRWGKLPPTWKSSARVASPLSGIRLYRVPEGLAWPGGLNKIANELGFERTGGIELIRWDHRYIVCAPSLNPDADGAVYFWVTPDGEIVKLPWGDELQERLAAVADGDESALDFELPSPAEVADMPEPWVAGLTEGRTWTSAGSVGPDGEISNDELKAWVAERDARPAAGAWPSGVCTAMDRTIKAHLLAIRKAGDDGGAHDAARDGAWAVIGDSAEGHIGVGTALVRLKNAFIEAVRLRRGTGASGDGERKARQEWTRIVRRGVSKVINEYEGGQDAEGGTDGYAEDDACAHAATAGSGRGGASGGRGGTGDTEGSGRADGGAAGDPLARRGARPAGSSAFDFERNDKGNAQRLKRHMGEDAVWCLPLGGWHIWNEKTGLWEVDLEGIRMTAEMMDVTNGMRDEAAYIEDEKQRIEFLKFVNGSSNVGRMDAAKTAMRSLRGVDVKGEQFDRDMTLLHCPNLTVQLTMQGLQSRPTERADFFRLSTGVRYMPGATHELWDKFLDKFLPNPDVRRWAQKLAGYSLQGENPARVLIVCKGKTSTGKTTFAEAIRTALGGYASTFNLSLFRASQDERPRVDIIEALPKRIVMAEEVSQAWHLHADQVKRATGNGMWEARALYGRGYIARVPAFTPWIATNNTPTIEGADAALLRRLRNIPFLIQVSQAEEDGLYKAKMRQPEVLEAILAWVVAGWELWLEDETLTDMPDAVLEQLAELGDEINDFAEMVSQIFDRDPAESTPFDLLWDRYEMWCIEHTVPERDRLSKNRFGRKLTEMGFGRDKLWDPSSGKTTQFRTGISVKLDRVSES